ncbi:zinc carboxypeptidase A 1-like isoform X2 [Anticarsia gemmatalis]|uniref:zinc carboxypeptidase A 1-like isoform X2 n=1 Tax=Anticarsia gemmatalis TaxID=129554 RepID=UPI003F763FF4
MFRRQLFLLLIVWGASGEEGQSGSNVTQVYHDAPFDEEVIENLDDGELPEDVERATVYDYLGEDWRPPPPAHSPAAGSGEGADGRRRVTPLNWHRAPTLPELINYLKDLSFTYYYFHLKSYGNSSKRNAIMVGSIVTGDRKPRILIDGGTVGRDHSSVVAVLFFLESIVHNFTQQPFHIQNKDWYFLPLLNPDGYNHSLHVQRNWAKNRRRLTWRCWGIDLNRNFPSGSTFNLLHYGDWCKGKFSIMCNPHYCGPSPFSEPESKAFQRLTVEYHFTAYFCIQSGGFKVIYPTSPTGGSDHMMHMIYTRTLANTLSMVGNNKYGNARVAQQGTAIGYMFHHDVLHSYIIKTQHTIYPAAVEVRGCLLRFASMFASVDNKWHG